MKPSEVSILIVDDEPMILETLSDLFEAFQFKVDIANSGNNAWSLCEKKKYDIIITDIRMPDGDGIELTKKVKNSDGVRPSVLVMSGFSDLLNEEIYHFGAEGKFNKPFDINSVRQAIQTCLLAPHIRWSQTLAEPETLLIRKSGVDIEDLETQKAVIFGRGGFFIAHNYAPPQKGSTVHFSIELKEPVPVTFRGAGIVRWIQNPGKNKTPGLGVEITTMGQAEAKIYCDLFGNLVPFIPSVVKFNTHLN